jgi:hypothetical protein
VFGRGAGGFSGWSKAKAELDAKVAAARKFAGVKKRMEGWVLHDLRRSFVTRVSERGFGQPHAIEAVVNHLGAAKTGIAGIYNKASYLNEKKKVLQRWADHLTALVTQAAAPIGEKDNLSALNARILVGARREERTIGSRIWCWLQVFPQCCAGRCIRRLEAGPARIRAALAFFSGAPAL